MLARARAVEDAGGKIIHLEIGEPDFPTAPHIVEAAVEALRAGATHYVPAPGIPPLRQAVAVAEFRRRRDIIVVGLNDIPGISCLEPQGALYAFPNITETGQTSADL